MGFENSLLQVLHVQLKGSVSLSRASHLRAIQGLVNRKKKMLEKCIICLFLLLFWCPPPHWTSLSFQTEKNLEDCLCHFSFTHFYSGLQSALAHSFLCWSRKLGDELSISNKLPASPAIPPEHVALGPHSVLDCFISAIPSLVSVGLFN